MTEDLRPLAMARLAMERQERTEQATADAQRAEAAMTHEDRVREQLMQDDRDRVHLGAPRREIERALREREEYRAARVAELTDELDRLRRNSPGANQEAMIGGGEITVTLAQQFGPPARRSSVADELAANQAERAAWHRDPVIRRQRALSLEEEIARTAGGPPVRSAASVSRSALPSRPPLTTYGPSDDPWAFGSTRSADF